MVRVNTDNTSHHDERSPTLGEESEANALCNKCIGRWFVNVDEWIPSTEEWAFALQQIPPPDRKKVMRYVFETDRKLALGSRLLQRFCVRSVLGLKDNEYEIARTKENKPYLKTEVGSMARSKLDRLGIRNFTFNVSHHGSIVALACEPDCVVGIDVVKDTERPFRGFTTASYFETFADTFTKDEWRTIRSAQTEDEQFQQFYRHWSMKEAYVKAHGFGLGIDLQTLSFGYTDNVEKAQHIARAQVLVNSTERRDMWSFTMVRIDSEHVATVCRAPPQGCHSTFASCLATGSLTAAQMKTCNSRAHPSFKRVGLSNLISSKKLEKLSQVRHPHHVLQHLSRDIIYPAIDDFRRRWLSYVYSSSHIPSIQFTSVPTVFSLSNIRCGDDDCSSFVRALSPCKKSILVVTGNVASDLHQLEEALLLMKDKFAEVFFTVGTHELQITKEEQCTGITSLRKLICVLEMCDSIGVRTRPCALATGDATELTVIPLFSHHGNSKEGSGATEIFGGTSTDSAYSWPVPLGTPSGTSISRFLTELNVEVQQQLNSPRVVEEYTANGAGGKVRPARGGSNITRENGGVLSFSHFGVNRSQHLRTQVHALAPDIHVFGDDTCCEEDCFTDGKTSHIRTSHSSVVIDSTVAPLCLERVWPRSNTEGSRWTDFSPVASLKSAVEKLVY